MGLGRKKMGEIGCGLVLEAPSRRNRSQWGERAVVIKRVVAAAGGGGAGLWEGEQSEMCARKSPHPLPTPSPAALT